MEASLITIVAPMGCYSARASFGTMQRETQSYIHNSVHHVSEQARKAIIRRILSSPRGDKSLHAAVECYFFRTARVHEWHILTDDQKSVRVSEFVSRVWAAANGIASSKGQHEVAQ